VKREALFVKGEQVTDTSRNGRTTREQGIYEIEDAFVDAVIKFLDSRKFKVGIWFVLGFSAAYFGQVILTIFNR